MLGIAIGLFIIAAMFGLFILFAVLQDRPTPKGAVFTHGPLAAAALIIVLYYIFTGNYSDGLLITSAVIFVLAAAGGLTMFTFDMMGKPIPKVIAIIHPIAAATALIMLIVYVYNQTLVS